MTTERPILFSAPMVRALLAGTKVQTRRVAKWRGTAPRLNLSFSGLGAFKGCAGWYLSSPGIGGAWEDRSDVTPCPYGQPGDRLWVREAWRADSDHDDKPPRDIGEGSHVWYEADRGLSAIRGLSRMGKLRPGMFMPRWASRILLEVTEVRVEPLRAISRGDAMAEGCPFANMAAGPDPRDWYRDLWDQINGDGAWDLNPFVWAVSFRVAKP